MDQEISSLHQQPWGRVIGLLLSCFVVLFGLFRQMAPAEIVIRSTATGLLTAFFVRALVWIVVTSDPGQDSDD
ncbi:MAG: hypothetical protein KDA91_03735 [Planctomycetaceae bacterium]|nr:hypothetical protein [Planctomycetaceae bacterium]